MRSLTPRVLAIWGTCGGWLLAASGCGKTGYDLFSSLEAGDGNPPLASGDGDPGPAGDGDGDRGMGGEPSRCPGLGCGGAFTFVTDEPDDFFDFGWGGSPTGSADPCRSQHLPGVFLVKLRFLESGMCLTPGPDIEIGDATGRRVELEPCQQDEAQYWIIVTDAFGAWEIRNEMTQMNLDIEFAATDDGTPLVLFEPHSLFNQRFAPLGDGMSMRLQPRSTYYSCLTQVERAVSIWPCDFQAADQEVEIVACQP